MCRGVCGRVLWRAQGKKRGLLRSWGRGLWGCLYVFVYESTSSVRRAVYGIRHRVCGPPTSTDHKMTTNAVKCL